MTNVKCDRIDCIHNLNMRVCGNSEIQLDIYGNCLCYVECVSANTYEEMIAILSEKENAYV